LIAPIVTILSLLIEITPQKPLRKCAIARPQHDDFAERRCKSSVEA